MWHDVTHRLNKIYRAFTSCLNKDKWKKHVQPVGSCVFPEALLAQFHSMPDLILTEIWILRRLTSLPWVQECVSGTCCTDWAQGQRERESERELKELHSCVHVQHSGRVQCRASLNTTSSLIQEWMWRSEQKKEDNLILNVMVFNTFRFFKAICKCLHHRDTQPASRVCSWQRFTVLQRSWLPLTGRICLAVTLAEPRPPEGTVKLQD